jgi:hypothetical protein
MTGRKLLSVVGPHSGCGKTLFVTHLARHLPGLGCLKVRPAHGHSESARAGEQAVEDRYYFEDPAALDAAGLDTALYLQAGAAQVEILRHEGNALPAGLVAAMDRFPVGMPVVVESSSAVRFLDPVAVVLLVLPPPREMKPRTEAILHRVTDLLINSPRRGDSPARHAAALRQEFRALSPRFTWFADLASEPPPGELLARLRGLLAEGAGS